MGSISPEEVRRRLAGDPSSIYAGLNLDPDELPEPPQPDLTEMMGGEEGDLSEQHDVPGLVDQSPILNDDSSAHEVHVYLEAV